MECEACRAGTHSPPCDDETCDCATCASLVKRRARFARARRKRGTVVRRTVSDDIAAEALALYASDPMVTWSDVGARFGFERTTIRKAVLRYCILNGERFPDPHRTGGDGGALTKATSMLLSPDALRVIRQYVRSATAAEALRDELVGLIRYQLTGKGKKT